MSTGRSVQCRYETIVLFLQNSYTVKCSTMRTFENGIVVNIYTLRTRLKKVKCVCFHSWKLI